VRPRQRKVGLPVVVELPERPVDRVMAVSTGGPEPTEMRVFVFVAIDAGIGRFPEDPRLVTIGTVGIQVVPEQGKPGEAVVEQDGGRPRGFVVTVLAALALFAPVRIYGPMAVIARRRERHVVDRLDVAVRAGEFAMCAEQCVPCIASVVESAVRPGRRCMTRGTIPAVVTIVFVVVEMACDTRRVQRVGKRVRRMAVAAGRFAVRALQRKTSIPLMVERRVRPGNGRMA